jgi:hypothetical protein
MYKIEAKKNRKIKYARKTRMDENKIEKKKKIIIYVHIDRRNKKKKVESSKVSATIHIKVVKVNHITSNNNKIKKSTRRKKGIVYI